MTTLTYAQRRALAHATISQLGIELSERCPYLTWETALIIYDETPSRSQIIKTVPTVEIIREITWHLTEGPLKDILNDVRHDMIRGRTPQAQLDFEKDD